MRNLIYPLALIFIITLASCSTLFENIPGVYTIDVQQGNIINQEMIDQLRPKMTKRQVLYIMGSSMLMDVFHQKRWDYLYSEQPGGEARVQKRLSLFFDGDELIGVQGDFRPSSLPVIRESKEVTVEVPKRDLEKTLWEKITGLFSDEPEIPSSKLPEDSIEEIVEEIEEVVETEKAEEIIDEVESENISVLPLEEVTSPQLEELSE